MFQHEAETPEFEEFREVVPMRRAAGSAEKEKTRVFKSRSTDFFSFQTSADVFRASLQSADTLLTRSRFGRRSRFNGGLSDN